jgi:hypothetical protein
MASPGPTVDGLYEFDIYGLGVRLVGATRQDAAAAERYFGGLSSALGHDADITVTFRDLGMPRSRIGVRGSLEGSGGPGGLLVGANGLRQGRVARVAFDELGRRQHIICGRGHGPVPLLLATVNLVQLGRGLVPVHGAAFVHHGIPTVATGWSRSGKTGMLLGALSEGARLLAPEWVYLKADGTQMFGLPQPIRIRDWHIRQLPAFRSRLGFRQYARLAAMRLALRGLATLPGATPWLGRAAEAIEDRSYVELGRDKPGRAVDDALSARPEMMVLLARHDEESLTVLPLSSAEMAIRLASIVEYEWDPLFQDYLRFRFAFPARRNEFIERARGTYLDRLGTALQGKDCYLIRHPDRPSIPRLMEVFAGLAHGAKRSEVPPSRSATVDPGPRDPGSRT